MVVSYTSILCIGGEVKITPCCKTASWHFAITDFDHLNIRCELCNKLWGYNALIVVKEGFNPLTYYCDKCHKSLLKALEEK